MQRRHHELPQFHVQPATWTTPAPISQLPTELLLIIFKLVYATTSHSHRPFSPYPFASVCTIWRDAMSLVPEFWRRIFIHLDSQTFSIDNISAHLEWSRNLTIHVTIIGNTDTFMTKEFEENQRSRNVTAVLRHHIGRCKTIHYDVAHSSSLPLISPDLYYSTPHLKNLCLKSSARSGRCPSAGVLKPSPGVQSELCFPVLEKLTLDGWNFIELYNNNPQWAKYQARAPRSFKIVHFRPNPAGKFPLGVALEYLSHIPFLCSFGLHDVDFEFESDEHMDNLPHNFDIASIDLSDLSSGLTAGVLSYANISMEPLERLNITRCPLTELSVIHHSSELILHDVHTTRDICNYLSLWGGLYLEIHNCPGFNDEVLETLASNPGGTIYAPYLLGLDLYKCTNISIEALQRMVYARRQNGNFDKFIELTISDCVLEVSIEARNWFIGQLEGFNVDGTEFCR